MDIGEMKFSNIKRILCICAILFTASLSAFAWGQKGHDIVCDIAQRHLTPRARKEISKLLDGRSIVYWSKWLDSASHTPEYAYTSTWHYKDVDKEQTYKDVQPCPTGDVVTAIEAQISALKSGELDKEHQALALKMLIHLIGDIHCPMHMARVKDKGGNMMQVQFFGQGLNLHSVWDTAIIDSVHEWGYREWADQIDILSKREIAEIVKGTPDQWGEETWMITCRIYEETPKGAKLSYDYVNRWQETVEQRLLYGGLRLARLLNEIF